jgi:hypothetical protein
METKNNGGSAFPEVTELVKSTDQYPHYKVWGSEGMTLRDYFAAKAMGGILADPNVTIGTDERANLLARSAYGIADAMLRARDA